MSFFEYFPEFPDADVPAEIRAAVDAGELVRVDAACNLIPSLALPEADRWADEAELFLCEADPTKRHGELRDACRFLVQNLSLSNEPIYEGGDVAAAISALKDARVAQQLLVWATNSDELSRAEAYRRAADALIGKTGGAR